jgi:hypothetical protein
MVYYRELAGSLENAVLIRITVDILDLFNFGLFFALAMINRQKPDVHARYMTGTALLTIPPGLARVFIIFGGMPFPLALQTTLFIAEVLALLLLFHDFRKGINIKSSLTIAIVLAIRHIIVLSAGAIWWQKFAKWFVTVFF